LFPELKKIDSIDHYETHFFNSKEIHLSFKAPNNSRCNTEHSSQVNENQSFNVYEESVAIDFFPEKSSPIQRKDNKFISFSIRSKNEQNEFNDSIIEDWKNIDYQDLRDYDTNDFLYAIYADKPGFKLYKVILERLEKHMNDGKNILGLVLKEYIDYLLKTYQFIDQVLFEKFSPKDLNAIMVNMIRDIHQFSRVFQISLAEFYQFKVLRKKNHDLNEFLDERNLENFVVQLIYQKQEVYDILYEVEKHLATLHLNDILLAKNLLEGIEIKDCFTPYEKKRKMQLLTPNMKRIYEDLNTKETDHAFDKGFDNFTIALDHYDNNFFKPFSKYKDLIEGIKFMKNPMEKLTIFSRPRQIIMKFMEDMNFPDFDHIDDRDEIKILFFLIMKTDIITVFIELNLIIHSVRADEHDLKIVNTLLKSVKKIIKMAHRNELESKLKEEGFLAKLIEKIYVQKIMTVSEQ